MRCVAVALSVLIAGVFTVASGQSQKSKNPSKNPYENYNEDFFMDMDFEPNLATPEVPKQASGAVKAYVLNVAKNYRGAGNVDLLRDGEVMLVTIPTDRLFLPNDSLLMEDTEPILAPLLNPVKDPMMFKLVIAVHTDDTGSEFYRDELSTSRLNSIYDWLMTKFDEGQIVQELIIIPYSMGSDMPLTDNDTRKHRSENRRLEFYYVPGPKLIEMASKGLLK